MDTKFDFGADADRQMVYVRAVNVSELPAEMQRQVIGHDTLYAVHAVDGERLALVRDRSLAFALARQNDLTPVTVH